MKYTTASAAKAIAPAVAQRRRVESFVCMLCTSAAACRRSSRVNATSAPRLTPAAAAIAAKSSALVHKADH